MFALTLLYIECTVWSYIVTESATCASRPLGLKPFEEPLVNLVVDDLVVEVVLLEGLPSSDVGLAGLVLQFSVKCLPLQYVWRPSFLCLAFSSGMSLLSGLRILKRSLGSEVGLELEWVEEEGLDCKEEVVDR